MRDESTLLLEKIYRSSRTAIDAMAEIAERNNSEEFGEFLERRRHRYFDIAEDANMRLRERRQLPEEENPWRRIAFIGGLRLKTIGSNTPNRLAEILIEGCVGGVNEMIGELHSGKRIEPQCTELAHMLIEAEQETIALLQSFL